MKSLLKGNEKKCKEWHDLIRFARPIRKVFEAGQACGGEHAVDIQEIHAWSSKELDRVTAVEKRWSVLLISRRQTQ